MYVLCMNMFQKIIQIIIKHKLVAFFLGLVLIIGGYKIYQPVFSTSGEVKVIIGSPNVTMVGKDFVSGDGATGQIIKIDDQTITIKVWGNVEKMITTTASTTIMRFKDTITSSDLKLDEEIMVIGNPTATGQIEAKFIRVLLPRSNSKVDFRSLMDPL